jgi:hypothetical protein
LVGGKGGDYFAFHCFDSLYFGWELNVLYHPTLGCVWFNEKKEGGQKLWKSTNELRLNLVQVHLLVSVVFFSFSFFPSYRTQH